MYTLLRARLRDQRRYCWTGYVYDISAKGMRFELDQALRPGTAVQVRAMLPGARHVTFTATGHVVRIHDDEEPPGPVRMGLVFERFVHETDRSRLVSYLQDKHLQAA